MERVPPQNLEAERAVLGSLLLDETCFDRVVDLVGAGDFYLESHRLIFDAICKLHEKGRPVDLISLADQLKSEGSLEKAGGVAGVSVIADRVPTAANVDYWAKLVREKSLLRRLINESTQIVSEAFDEPDNLEKFLDRAESRILNISMDQTGMPYQPMRSLVKHSFAIIEEFAEKKQVVTGVPTGFNDLDVLTSGFQPSDLIILAGRPSHGKTAIALNIARNAAIDHNKTVVFFSLEMSREQLVMRMFCSEAKFNLKRLRTGMISSRDWPKLTQAAGILSEAPIFIDDSSSLSVLEMKARSRRIKSEHGLDMVIVDYLQLIRGSEWGRRRDSREQEVSEMSRSLKAMAKELNVPVLALSQLNRAVEQRDDKTPRLADLRESGAIEQDADVVMFISRPCLFKKRIKGMVGGSEEDIINPNIMEDSEDYEADDRYAELIVAKQRNGPLGKVELNFFSDYTLFRPLETRYTEDYSPEISTYE
jgi:replicative DNA helicase